MRTPCLASLLILLATSVPGTAASAAAVPAASAGQPAGIDHTAFPSLGALPRRSFVIDTDALTFDGRPGGILVQRADGRSIAVFTFDGGAVVPAGAVISVRGQHPVALGVLGDLVVSGVIDASGFDAVSTVAGAAGPGGGAGGKGATCGTLIPDPGSGPGGGLPGKSTGANGTGGGGAGFGGLGEKGGGFGGLGGVSYGDLTALAEGGSGGGGGGGSCPFGALSLGGGGGGGGGLVELTALNTVSILGGTILADGGRGADGGGTPNIGGGGGGGSGGGIAVRGFNVELDMFASLSANGGAGGLAGTWSGGHGAGGRILLLHNSLGSFCDLTVNSIFAMGKSGDALGLGSIDIVADPAEGSPGPQVAFSLPLDPADFASLGPWPGGNLHFDTSSGTYTVNGAGGGGGGVVVEQGVCTTDLGVFTFDGGATLAAGTTITATGSFPLVLLFQGDVTVAGSLDVSGAAGGPGGSGFSGPGGAPGPGGYPGGRGGLCDDFDGFGFGGGTGGASSASSLSVTAGKGGGFGGQGGNAGGLGGPAYGDLFIALQGGSGGGGGGSVCATPFVPNGGGGGGGGGGAAYIGASGTLSCTGAALRADGGAGDIDLASQSAGGSGSGGAIVLAANQIVLDSATTISADGGGQLLTFGGGGGRLLVLTSAGGLSNGTVPGALSVTGGPTAQDGVIDIAVCQQDLGFDGPGNAFLSVCGEGLATGDESTMRLSTEVPTVFCSLAMTRVATSMPTFIPDLGGTLAAFPFFALPVFRTDVNGVVEVPVHGGGSLELVIQAWLVDDSSPAGLSLSNAVELDFLP